MKDEPAWTYVVANGDSPGELTEDVRVMIEHGWQPIGGVSVSIALDTGEAGGIYEKYAQALVKRKSGG